MVFPENLKTPAYLFDTDAFAERIRKVKTVLPDLPLTYSVKANPFLINEALAPDSEEPEMLSHLEVCSPGELEICKARNIPGEKIIYSGVMKERWDVEKAVSYGVDILTAESLLHLSYANEVVLNLQKAPYKVLLRLTSGNQFGMSEEEILHVISHKEEYKGLHFYGIHYYSGTQKKQRQVSRDIQKIEKLLGMLKTQCNYEPALVEYGPGASAEYFNEPYEEKDWESFGEICREIRSFAKLYPTGIEMGRFLASDCGHYVTRVKDLKKNSDTNYVICDGGIHHLRYHGQTLAMQIPPVDAYHNHTCLDKEGALVPYMVCGSLCTTADVLVREVMLPKLELDDLLCFHRCGAYSVTEGTFFFLSRTMPQVWSFNKEAGYRLLRDAKEAYLFNTTEMKKENQVII